LLYALYMYYGTIIIIIIIIIIITADCSETRAFDSFFEKASGDFF